MKLRTGGRMPTLLASIGLAVVMAFGGCGGGDAAEEEARQEGAQLSQSINLADCTDWNEGSVEGRLGTIREIREFLGTQVPGTGRSASSLDDEQAYDLFDGWCENEFARGFRLYKLYARAQAFSR